MNMLQTSQVAVDRPITGTSALRSRGPAVVHKGARTGLESVIFTYELTHTPTPVMG